MYPVDLDYVQPFISVSQSPKYSTLARDPPLAWYCKHTCRHCSLAHPHCAGLGWPQVFLFDLLASHL